MHEKTTSCKADIRISEHFSRQTFAKKNLSEQLFEIRTREEAAIDNEGKQATYREEMQDPHQFVHLKEGNA